MTRTRTTTKIC